MSLRDIRKKVKKGFSEMMEIPSDIMLDLPKIVIVGDVQVFIENHRGIVEYSTETVRIHVGNGEVGIAGENLMVRNILTEEICVEGKIKSLTFLDQG